MPDSSPNCPARRRTANRLITTANLEHLIDQRPLDEEAKQAQADYHNQTIRGYVLTRLSILLFILIQRLIWADGFTLDELRLEQIAHALLAPFALDTQ
ncbi:MAG: hypothetical protein Kow00105_10400 [Phycisphaeraceae bacterium]